MKRRASLKQNNQGSTFVLALMVITLVTILAVSLLAASAHNIAMKNVDRNSKVTFYTAESVMDEMRAGVGLDSMNYLGKSYEEVLTTVIQEDVAGYSYIIDNESANIRFKSLFVESMLEKITDGKLEFSEYSEEVLSGDETVQQQVINYLQGYIKGYDEGMAKVKSIGLIKGYRNSTSGLSFLIVLEDVCVQYKEQKSGETYFSTVTSNIEIEFPNMTVDFAATNRLDGFISYGLIADNSLYVKGSKATIHSSIYAGDTISIMSDSLSSGEMHASSLTGDNINIVCGGNVDGGNITVTGNADVKSVLDISGANIWCSNLITGTFQQSGKDVTAGATINIDSFCNTFVKDDLTAEGNNSVLDINGEYYGYSYDGNDSSNLHAASSAIIINGKKAMLTIGTSKMIIGGHSYIELDGSDDYMTGEALSFKGDQEIYLVPSKYLAINYDQTVSNPMPATIWADVVAASEAEGSSVKLCDVSDFFAYKQGYLAATPYKVVTASNGLVYIYLNFRDKDSAADYVYDVANRKNGANATLYEALNKYTNNLFGGTGYVKITGDNASVYTKGALLVTNGTTAGVANGTTSSTIDDMSYASGTLSVSNDEFVLTSMDLKNRYDIISHLLVDIPWTDLDDGGDRYIVDDIDAALLDKANYLMAGNEMTTESMFDVIVDRALITSKPYNDEGTYVQYGEAGYNYIKIAIDGNYVVPEHCHGGIIVATGTVSLDHDFNGLIIAGDNIDISDNAKITSSAAMIEYLIRTDLAFDDETQVEEVSLKQYFYAYKNVATEDDSREQVKVEAVNYKDIVNFNNWRKYED